MTQDKSSKQECVDTVQSLYNLVKERTVKKSIPASLTIISEYSTLKMVMLDNAGFISLTSYFAKPRTDCMMTFNVNADEIVLPKANLVRGTGTSFAGTTICDDEEFSEEFALMLLSAQSLQNAYTNRKAKIKYKAI